MNEEAVVEDQLEQIRMRHRMLKYSSESWEDIGHLLSLLDRREMQKPDALAYLRECLNSNKYPATSDMIAVIDELEACRANRIADLEFILCLLNEHCVGTKVPRLVQARLDRLRGIKPSQRAAVKMLERLRNSIADRRERTADLGAKSGISEAIATIDREIDRLDQQSWRLNHDES